MAVLKPRVVAAAVVMSLATWVLLLWYAHNTSFTAQKLCDILYQRIEISNRTIGKPGFTGYQYYLHHPKELEAAHKAAKDTLDALPCRPKEGG